MATDPKKPRSDVDEKVGAYDKPAKSAGPNILLIIILIALAVLLALWLFTDIL